MQSLHSHRLDSAGPMHSGIPQAGLDACRYGYGYTFACGSNVVDSN